MSAEGSFAIFVFSVFFVVKKARYNFFPKFMHAITTHILDIALGLPAVGVPVRLEHHRDGAWHAAGIAITSEDGRAHPLEPNGEAAPLTKGDYRLTFEVAAYFKTRETKAFFPFVQITFTVADEKDYHVPLLLGPFGYSTYLGS